MNYVDGVTINIQNQLNAKYVAATQTTGTWQAGTGGTASLVTPANIKAAIIALETTPVKAWVNFNGANASIRASTGISSVTRNGLGDYTITFTGSLMSDANYAVVGSAGLTQTDNRSCVDIYSMATASCRITVTNHGNGFRRDATFVCVSFMR